MPSYHRLGQLPSKRHTQFRKPDGGLFAEELVGADGFSGLYSLVYHHHLPPAARAIEPAGDAPLDAAAQSTQRNHHFKTRGLPAGTDAIAGRHALMFNDDVAISVVTPTAPTHYFFKNATADELYYVHEGTGRLRTPFGELSLSPGDYVVIPRGTIYRIEHDEGARFLIVESRGPIETPERYRNTHGQLLEQAPFAERDVRRPENLETIVETGEFEVRVKVGTQVTSYCQPHHPFDVVGWDGYLYPWAVSIHDIEPMAGRIHRPPPVHATFEGDGFVVCSFVPRKLDWDPNAVPIPPYHSNNDCDEVLYYAEGSVAQRRGMERGSITLHPRGIPHGPAPGSVEGALGKTETDEIMVMVDTFRPLSITQRALDVADPAYALSWSTTD